MALALVSQGVTAALAIGTETSLVAPAIPTAPTTYVARVDASSLAAGELLLLKAYTRTLSNILPNDDADFEGGTGTWGTLGQIVNCTVAQSNAQALVGSNSMRMTATGAGDMSATNVGSNQQAVPGQQFTGVASFRAATTVRNVQVVLTWYNAAQSVLSTSTGTAVPDTNSGWTQATVTAVAPASTAFVTLKVYVVSAGAGEQHYVDCAMLTPGSSTTWLPGASELVEQSVEIQGGSDPVVWVSNPIPTDVTVKFTATQTTGTGRKIKWKLLSL